MVARKKNNPDPKPRPRPAITVEGRENQLIAQAISLAERQLADGTASAQVISHYLKLGSSRERLEQERLARENDLLRAKAEAMESAKEIQALYQEALNAMRTYAGQETDNYSEDDET